MKKLLLSSLLFLFGMSTLYALNPGETISAPALKDAQDRPASIPFFGQKTLTIFYTDPDVKDQNDPLADFLVDQKLPQDKYSGLGVANLADTWKPNDLVRIFVREKIKKYNKTILTDTNHTLKNSWNLGDCNEKSVVIILDKNKKVLFVHKGQVPSSRFNEILKIIKETF